MKKVLAYMPMKNWSKVFGCIFAVLIGLAALLVCVCAVLWLFGQHLYLPPYSSGELCSLSFGAIVVLCMFWAGLHWCMKSKRWYTVVLKVFVLSAVMLITVWLLLIAWVFGGRSGSFQRCDSPDGQHSIVIESESQFAVEWGTVYVITSPVTMKEIGTFNGPFYPGTQNVIWHDTYVELIRGEETLRFDYTQ